jgi:hypothetical protein
MSPRTVQFAWSSQRSVTKILPSTVPRTFTDFVLISPRTRACSPDRKRSSGNDCALHLAIEEQLVQEFDRAFDRNSFGKKSGAWDDRWLWPIRFGKRLHGEDCAELFGILEAESKS